MLDTAGKMGSRMATIIEVAEKAGVSIKTESRVNNGYTHV